jgi:hypothetical protein
MGDEKRETIADHERSPASDAADDVDIGPPAVNEQDEREEPEGSSEAMEPKTDRDGKPIVPPSRGSNT